MASVIRGTERRRADTARPGLGYLLAFGLLAGAIAVASASLAEAQNTDPDSAPEGATDLGEISELDEPLFPRNALDGVDDTVDYYAFQLAYPATVGLGLRQLDFDADLYLEDDAEKVLAESVTANLANEWIELDLPAGSYYARVVARAPGSNAYVFRYGADRLPDGTLVGLVVTSSEVGRLDISWAAAHPAPTDYRVNWARAGEPFPTWTDDSGNAFPTANELTLDALEAGAEYAVKVRARYEGQAPGPWSDVVRRAVTEESVVRSVRKDTARPRLTLQSEALTSTESIAPRSSTSTSALVSTVGQSSDTERRLGFTSAVAQVFTTGARAADLESATVGMRAVTRHSNLQVSLWSVDEDGRPAAKLFEFRRPSGGVTADTANVFAAPSRTILEPNTTYALVAREEGLALTSSEVWTTTSGSVDAGGAEGWTVSPDLLVRARDQSWADASSVTARLRMAVSGRTRLHLARVEFTEDAHQAFEGGSIVVGLRLDRAAGVDFVVPIVATAQHGASTADYEAPGSVSFYAGDTEARLTFSASADEVSDPGEQVELSLGTLPEQLAADDRSETTVSIFDGVAVRVGFPRSSYSVEEGGEVEVTVSLSRDPGREVVAPIEVTHQDGATDGDYSGLPESVTFQSGETEATFTLTATDDSGDDDGESLLLGFGDLPTRVSADEVSATTVVRLDDDDAPSSVTVSFGQSAYYVAEGGTVTVRATLSDDPERALVIPVGKSLRNGASNSDFSVASSVRFEPGQTSASIEFSASTDSAADDGEQVRLQFSGSLPAGVTAGSPGTTTVTINRNLVLLRNLGQTIASSETLTEERSIQIGAIDSVLRTVAVTRHVGFTTGASPAGYALKAVRVRFSHSGVAGTGIPADSGIDAAASILQDGVEVATLTAPSGVPTAGLSGIAVFTAPSGTTLLPSTFYRLAVTVDGDTDDLNALTADIRIPGTPGTGADAGSRPGWSFSGGNLYQIELHGTIRPLPEVSVGFAEATYPVTEGGSVDVTLNLSADPEREVRVPLTVTPQGGASAADYSGAPEYVSFGPGETAASFTLTAVQDVADDDNESLRLGLGPLPANVAGGSTVNAVVTLVDDDEADGQTVSVSFAESAYDVGEGESVEVALSLDHVPGRVVHVPLAATARGGLSGGDYSGVPKRVTFAADQTEASFTLSATPDGINDDGESLALGFGTLPRHVQAGDTAATVVTFVDDDPDQVNVAFGKDAYTVPEGGVAEVRITLSAASEQALTIPLLVRPQGASRSDYQVPTTVTFLPRQTVRNIPFTATDDIHDDDGESVTLTLGDLPADTTAGSTPATTITITDNDAIAVGFSPDVYDVDEGGEVEVVLLLSEALEEQAVIPIVVTPSGGASDADYTAPPANVTFAAGQTRTSLTVSAESDDLDDDGESLLLTFGAPPAGVATDPSNLPAQASVRIRDDDAPDSVTLNFARAAYNVAEGMTVAVEVTLSDDPEREVVIPITTALQAGASSADFSVPASIRFGAGQTSASIAFVASSDTTADDGERVQLGFGTLPRGVAVGGASTATVTINEQLVLISNAAQSTSGHADLVVGSSLPRVSVDFVTGSHPTGYDLHSIRALMSHSSVQGSGIPAAVDSPLRARIVRDGSEVAQLTVPSGALSGLESLAAPAGTRLLPGARYGIEFWFAADPGVTTVRLPTTTSGAPDPGAAPGWTLPQSGSARLQFEVRGATRPIPSVSASFAMDTYSVPEGGSAEITVHLSADPDRRVRVPITVTRRGGAAAADYSGVPEHVTFEAGETEADFTLRAVQDIADDDGESLLLGFGDLPASVSPGTTASAVVLLADDEEGGPLVSTVGQSSDTERRLGFTSAVAQLFTTGARAADLESATVGMRAVTQHSNLQVSLWSVDEDGRPAAKLFEFRRPSGGVTADTANVFAAPSRTILEPNTTYALVAREEGLALTSSEVWTTTSGSVDAGGAEGWTVSPELLVRADDQSWADAAPAMARLRMAVSGRTRTHLARVEFTEDSHLAFEGASTVVGLRLDRAAGVDFVVPIVATPQHGASTADYEAPDSVTFHAGETEARFTFSASADEVSDPGEQVELSLGTLPEQLAAHDRSETTVSIFDGVAVRVGFPQTSYSVREGGEVEVTVSLSRDPGREVVAPIEVTHQDGATDGDYSGLPETVTFQSGETEATFTLTATDDSGDDDGESLLLGFGDLPTRVSADEVSATTVVRLDDDDAPSSVTVSFGQSAYYVAEGGTVTVRATLSDDPERALVIPVGKSLRNGASNSDFSVASSVRFEPGQTSASIEFSASTDSAADDGEQVRLQFSGSLPAGVTAGSPGTTTVTINRNLVLLRNLGQTIASSETLTEERSIQIGAIDSVLRTVAVTRHVGFTTGASPAGYALKAVRVRFSHSGVAGTGIPADSGIDAAASILQDGVEVATLTAPSGVPTAGLSGIAVFTAPSGTTLLPSTFYRLAVTVDGDTDDLNALTADIRIPGTPGTGADAGSQPGWSFSGGNLYQIELHGSVRPLPEVSVGFAEATYSVTEGGSVEVTLNLSADPERALQVPLTVTPQGGASAADYSGAPEYVSFSPGETAASFTLSAVQDVADDDNESLRLGLGPLPANVAAGSTVNAVVTLVDDDAADGQTVSVSFAESAYDVGEGESVEVALTLDQVPGRVVHVPIAATARGGASDGDYSGVPKRVTFAAGQTEASFTLSATPDGINDDGESLALGFGTLPRHVQAGDTAATVVTFVDDDPEPVSVTFGRDAYTVPEGGVVEVRVTLSAVPQQTLTVPLLVRPHGASRSDYQVPTTVTFLPRQTVKRISFIATDDTHDDDGESVTLTLGDLPADTTSGTVPATTITITDNDVLVTLFGEDLRDDTLTEGVVTVDKWKGAATHFRSTIEPARDADWFKVTLVAGQKYRFSLMGEHRRRGRTLAEPMIVGIYTGPDEYVDDTDAVPRPEGRSPTGGAEALVHYVAAQDGAHWVSVRGFDGQTGVYDFRVLAVPDDYSPDGIGTTETLVLGETREGKIDHDADTDWFRIALRAGVTYRAEITPKRSGSSLCPSMAVYSADEHLQLDGRGSRVCNTTYFTPTRSEDYYFVALSRTYRTGGYSFTITEETP